MSTLTLRARGRARADDVWERYARADAWTTWAPQIRRVESTAERIGAGVRGRVFGVGGLRIRFVVDEVDEVARTWVWRVWLGPIALRLAHGVEETRSGSSTWLRVTGPLPIVIAYAPVAGLALRRLVTP